MTFWTRLASLRSRKPGWCCGARANAKSPTLPSPRRTRPTTRKRAGRRGAAVPAGRGPSVPPPQPATALHTAAGWTVLLLVFPTSGGDGEPGLTACDRDCLGLLTQAKEPLSGVRVRAELERRGIAVYGEATVKRSLAKLRRRGV